MSKSDNYIYKDNEVFRIEFSGANPIYIGFAYSGASTADAVWKIKKLTWSGSTPTASGFPNASPSYTFIWDNRASYAYS